MAKPGNKTPQQKAEATRKILAALKTGATVEAACSFARTTKQSWYAWLKKDPALRADYEEALAHSEISLVTEIKKDKSWQSKAWLLERRFPDRWGKREPAPLQETKDKGGSGVVKTVPRGFLSEADRIAAAGALEPTT